MIIAVGSKNIVKVQAVKEAFEETEQFKNYQVKVWKDENNNWVRPFKLEEGKSTINIAMDLLEEAGIFSR